MGVVAASEESWCAEPRIPIDEPRMAEWRIRVDEPWNQPFPPVQY